MDSTLQSIIVILFIGLPVAYFVLRFFFKNHLMFRIGFVWMINLFIVAIGTRLSASFPDAYPQWLSLSVIILLSWVCIFITHKNVQKPIADIEEKLNLMSKGYMKFGLNIKDLKRKDEIGNLNNSMMNLSREFINVIENIKSVSEQIRHSSLQLKSTSDELSSGASTEAASIEEISASMEQMVKSISQNSENSTITNEVASKAYESVNSSNQSARKAIKALEKITQKINVINDIALQTNILSLNAAVEAARSKENSSGFAVVATEVRKLAELSKNAALEIEKISNEASDISNGASVKLSETVTLIDRTSELVSLIETASNEQDSNAQQINSAITEINGSIQSSAATAEEMSASAEELQRYANDLYENISLFNTSKVIEIDKREEPKSKKPNKPKKKSWYKLRKAS
jgi:methyl-accepting chemotaxis protein